MRGGFRRSLLALFLCAAAAAVAVAVPGDLDLRFATDGRRVIDYGGNDAATDVAIRPDGRIIAAGTGNALSDVAVQALLQGGDGDPSLDAEGSLAINLGGQDGARAMALQPDGKVVLAGQKFFGGAPGGADRCWAGWAATAFSASGARPAPQGRGARRLPGRRRARPRRLRGAPDALTMRFYKTAT